MNHKNMLRVATMLIITTPLISHTMQRTLTLLKRLPVGSGRRSFFSYAPELRNTINTGTFTLCDTKTIIESTLPNTDLLNKCEVNRLVEYIVFKATEYKSQEKKYAGVLNQLQEHGYSSNNECCINTMMHSAVQADLPYITKQLLQQNQLLIQATDMSDCIPLHYAQSAEVAQILVNGGSDIETCDKNGNRPLHVVPADVVLFLLHAGAQKHPKNHLFLHMPCDGWQGVTPLRKAVNEGNLEKCAALLSDPFIISSAPEKNEKKLLIALINLRYWQTDSLVYWKIKNMIKAHSPYPFEKK